ncbi:coiled-coil domain-containing protein [Acrasis kona]|uniref:Coiled-coil domain-containing protein n=1 Tax=Acrasis kona TaxID=1008807 RepID=A0AAW2ZMG0_9EUKA
MNNINLTSPMDNGGYDDDTFDHETEEEITELERRLKLLDGERKASYETRHNAMKKNKDTLESVKRENKDLRDALTKIHREQGSTNGKSFQERLYERLETNVHNKRKEFDDAQHVVKALQIKLKGKQDKLNDLVVEKAPILTDDSPLTRQIRILENRLDKAMIKYNEAQSIRKTYEQILRRLKEERIGFDNQLQSIERTLRAKEHDYRDLLNMSHEANYMREQSKTELQNTRNEFDETSREKDKEMKDKRQYVQARIEMTMKLSKREAAKHNKSDINNHFGQSMDEKGFGAFGDNKLELEMEKVQKAEERWRKIKEVTGVNDANEVIQKYLTSSDTHKNLAAMTKDAQQKIDALVLKRASLKSRLEDMKYSQSSGLGSRRIVDEFMQQLAESSANCERSLTQYERVARILINVKAGIEHLDDKLAVVIGAASKDPHNLDPPSLDAKEESQQVLESLNSCAEKLGRLTKAANRKSSRKAAGSSKEETNPAPEDGAAAQPIASPSNKSTPPNLFNSSLNLSSGMIKISDNNIRIPINEYEYEDDNFEEEPEEDGDVPDRSQLKRMAAFALEKNKKSGKRRGKNDDN